MPGHSVAAVGVDVGGTKLVAGLVDADGRVLQRVRVDTPAAEPAAIAPLVATLASDLAGGEDGVPVGVGVAGIVDLDGTVRYSPNIAWTDEPLRDRVAELVAGQVTVDNDANAAAWAEYTAGAAAAARSCVMFTVGTGVGGGLVLDGVLVRGAHGLGAELGHMIVVEGGPPCPCGNRGCLEAVASGTAIGRVARERVAAGGVPDGSALHRLPPDELTGKAVTHAAQDGDAAALDVLAGCGFWLGVGIATAVNAFDPDVVVVGGGAMEAGELLLQPARASFAERLMGRGHRPVSPVVAAALGDEAGVVGAALLALDAAG